MSEPSLPVDTLRDATPHFRRPFTPEAIGWKVQSTWGPKDKPKTGGMVIPFIDARLVFERLDAVALGDWEDHTEPVAGNPNAMICRLKVFGMTRSDVGESTHSLKAASSDAIKRVGVRFGIGAVIYAMNRAMLDASADGSMKGTGKKARPTLKQKSVKGKHTLELPDEGREWLRDNYYAVFIDRKQDVFGDPLDHGDTSETLGLEGAEARPQDLGDADLEAETIALRALFETVPKANRRGKMSAAQFTAKLKACDTEAKLAGLRKEVEELG